MSAHHRARYASCTCRLSGTLPLGLLLLSHLSWLEAGKNEFEGTLVVPAELASGPPADATQTSRFEDFDVDSNKVTAEAGRSCLLAHDLAAFGGPESAADCEMLTAAPNPLLLVLQLAGTIPLELLHWVTETLDLASNRLTGTLPLIENESLRVGPSSARSLVL
eukprot:GHUV01039634.1.p1 GENE.GHUV01039634.1~~GHUV01039634.1.p1  ORF type:complete len:164 (-),score=30.33 GHUV01039634.1:342-833(-)